MSGQSLGQEYSSLFPCIDRNIFVIKNKSTMKLNELSPLWCRIIFH
ncbi:hypothetical protein ECKG_02452 [Escherichia coli TA206]|nr:hypothetical protein EcF11_3472 [Escherichia coli F11]EGI25555.1 hypothetical protein ECKG_02452 [Escherichia coli TA206]